MSSVRMCDRCTTVFSENEEGWETYTANKRTKEGTVSRVLDACPSCALSSGGVVSEPKILRGSDL